MKKWHNCKEISPTLRDITILYEDTKTEKKTNVFHIKTNSSHPLEILGVTHMTRELEGVLGKFIVVLTKLWNNSVRSVYIHNLLVLEYSKATSKLFAIQNLQKPRKSPWELTSRSHNPHGQDILLPSRGRAGEAMRLLHHLLSNKVTQLMRGFSLKANIQTE